MSTLSSSKSYRRFIKHVHNNNYYNGYSSIGLMFTFGKTTSPYPTLQFPFSSLSITKYVPFSTITRPDHLSRLFRPPIPTVSSVSRSTDGKSIDITYTSTTSVSPSVISSSVSSSSSTTTTSVPQPNSYTYRYSGVWLRDHCLCSECTHPVTLQRCMNTQTLSPETTLMDTVNFDAATNTVTVQWRMIPKNNNINNNNGSSSSSREANSHTSHFPVSWLINQAYHLPIPSPTSSDTWQTYLHHHHNPSSSSSFLPFLNDISIDNRYRCLWEASTFPTIADYPRVNKRSFLKHDRTVVESLLAIRDEGFVLVEGVDPTIKATEKICRRFSPHLRSTLYGEGMWTTHIASNQTNINDTAFTAAPLAPHTDGNYFQDSPGIQVFHAIEADPHGGGDSLLVDGFRIAQEMAHNFPESFYILSQLYIPYHHTDPEHSMVQYKRTFNFRSSSLYNKYLYTDPYLSFPPMNADIPSSSSSSTNVSSSYTQFLKEIMTMDIQHTIESIHFNNDDRAPLRDLPLSFYEIYGTETMPKVYEAIQIFQSYINNPRFILRFCLRPGTVLFFNNNRVLHGRTGFASNSRRTLAGCYINEEDWKSRLRILGNKVTREENFLKQKGTLQKKTRKIQP